MRVVVNGEIVRERRHGLGLNQAEACQQLGFSLRTYQRAETGDPISVVTAKAIADRMGIQLETLLVDRSEDPVVSAFAAADDAIQRELARPGEYGAKEVVAVLSLLLVRFGSSMAREFDDTEYAIAALDAGIATAKRAIRGHD